MYIIFNYIYIFEGMLTTEKIIIGVGVSTEKDTVKAVREAAQQARAGIRAKTIDLAIVFSSIDFAHPNTIKTISNLLGPVPIIGCCGAALISNKGIFRYGVSIMLLSLPKTIYFNTALVKEIRAKTALSAGEELGEKLLHNFHGVSRHLAVIFSDGLIEEGSNLILGLQEKLGTSFPLVGASALDNLRSLKTYLYFNQEITNDAACGIIWGGKLNFAWGIKHGWKPLGKPHRVTKAKANIVYEIDGVPAVKTYEEYLARNLTELRKELRRISIFYPIGIRLPEVEEYLLRNILSIENDGALVFQGNVPQDSTIRLMIGTKESCLNATRQALEEVKTGLEGRKMSFAFVFDSISRYILLGRQANKELEIIKEGLGADTPIIGIYTYGEQAPLRATKYQGKAYFHNQTVAILGIEG